MRYSDYTGKDLMMEVEQSDLGRYSPEDDQFNKREIGDTRKPKLTLKMINKLKKIRATKSLENAKKEELLGIMYGLDNQGDDDGGL